LQDKHKEETQVTECTQKTLDLPTVKKRKVEVEFSGGDITSDGGVLLLRQADRKLGLTKRVAALLPDPRVQYLVQHQAVSLVRQRVYGLALGYEDLNDHAALRTDPAIQTAVETTKELASAPTLCRFESWATREVAVGLHGVLIETFIQSFKEAPGELVLDFDATEDRVHGDQVGRAFNAYYDDHCFLPLYVFAGSQLLVSYLRPINKDGALHAGAILKLLVMRLRAAWPDVKLIFRGDGGFLKPRIMHWCEQNHVGYIIGIGKNKRLTAMAQEEIDEAARLHEKTGEKQRIFKNLSYAADTWKIARRVIAKAEHTAEGSNPRFIVTNLPGGARYLYEDVYCGRGDMENRIKEQKLGLFSDRTSCHEWYSNQLRLLLSSLAYVLMDAIRRLALKGTELATAQVETIRLKLLKIGGAVVRNTRRIRLLLASACPYQDLFFQVAAALGPD
jgi:hypothetical protein